MLMLMLNCIALAIVALLPVFDVTAASTKGCHVLFALSISLSQRLLSFDSFSFLDLCRGRILK